MVVLTVAGPDGAVPTQPDAVVRALVAAGLRAHLRVAEPDDVIATSGPAFRIVDVVERVRADLVVVGTPRPSLRTRLGGLRRGRAG